MIALLFAISLFSFAIAMPKPTSFTTTPANGTPIAPPAKSTTSVNDLVRDAHVKHSLDWLAKNANWITDEQARITEIPAPPFDEAQRAAYMKKTLAGLGLHVHTDELGNVIGERPGASNDEIVIIAAHLDTVFPAGTDVHVRRANQILSAPGISDNGTGLASLVGIARALNEARIKTHCTLIFAADVGEEGEGNLRGIRKIVEDYKPRLAAVIALDGASTDYVVTQALASRRLEITITGPGGHSWTDFGAPNAINALSRGIARFLKFEIPTNPRTTFNFGEIEGGGSVNAIPSRAAVKVDIRSEQEREIARLESAMRDAIRAGIQEEMDSAKSRGMLLPDSVPLEMNARALGIRPGGELPANSPLFNAVMDADRFLGNRSRTERSSTDANIPLSLGIPAIALGCGGHAGGAHTLTEWYDPAGREMGLQRILLTLLSTAGLEK